MTIDTVKLIPPTLLTLAVPMLFVSPLWACIMTVAAGIIGITMDQMFP